MDNNYQYYKTLNRCDIIRLLASGKDGINEWNIRRKFLSDKMIPKIYGADLCGAILSGANLAKINLSGSNFSSANLRSVNFRNANLTKVNFSRADLRDSDLRDSDLSDANLTGANLSSANLQGANLFNSNMIEANFHLTLLQGASFAEALFGGTIFGDVDLSTVRNLEFTSHRGPSTISFNAFERSNGEIPDPFLRQCGVPPWLVLSAKLYDSSITPPRFVDLQYEIYDLWVKGREMINGCFISYSWNDSKFVGKLYDRMLAENINVWLDKHDMIAGTIQSQVWRAIQLKQVVILVLSENSIRSDWVENELDMAREKEKREARAVLCPITLDDAWRAKIDAFGQSGDPNRALWRTLQSKLVLDFSKWKTKAFNDSFVKLIRGLRINYTT